MPNPTSQLQPEPNSGPGVAEAESPIAPLPVPPPPTPESTQRTSVLTQQPKAAVLIGTLVALALGAGAGFAVGVATRPDPMTSTAYQELQEQLASAVAERDLAAATVSGATRDADLYRAELAELEGEVKDLEQARDAAKTRTDELDVRAADLDDQEADLRTRELAVGLAEEEEAASGVAGSGTFEVGVDIQPGTYRSTGGDACYWARLRTAGGIIDNHFGSGPAVVTIKASDALFETQGCGDWVKRK